MKTQRLSGAWILALVIFLVASPQFVGGQSLLLPTKLQTRPSGFVEPVWPKFTKEVTITWWTWVVNADKLAAAFNRLYPNIHINIPTVGAGTSLYTKLTTALKAGTGAPDLAHIERHILPQYVYTGALSDITKYVEGYRSLYPDWVWDQVTFGGKIYAISTDVAPLELLYRKDVFDKYGLRVPKTWSEYEQLAAKLHSVAPDIFTSFWPGTGAGQCISALLWQRGVTPFEETPQGWVVAINTPAAKDVASYWVNMVKKGYLQETSWFSPTWISDLQKGKFATWVDGAWGPTYGLEPFLKGTSQQWRAAEVPQWKAGETMNGANGGETYSIPVQRKENLEASLLFAESMDLSEIGVNMSLVDKDNGGAGLIMMANTYSSKCSSFHSLVPFLGNQDHNALAEKMLSWVPKSFQWSPWTGFVFDDMELELTKAIHGQQSSDQAMDNVQQHVVDFAKSQGFTVTVK